MQATAPFLMILYISEQSPIKLRDIKKNKQQPHQLILLMTAA
jgi:hypothetical protein